MKIFKFLTCLMLIPSLAFGGASRNLDGISDGIDISKPGGLVVGTDSFTRMIWIFWTQGDDTIDETIFHQQDGTGVGRGWLRIDDDGASCSGTDPMVSGLGGISTCGSGTSQNVWIHAAIVSNESDGTITGYKNSVQDLTASVTVEAATGILRIGLHKTSTAEDFEGQVAHSVLCEGAMSPGAIIEMALNPEAASPAYCGSGYYNYLPVWGTSSPESDLSGNGLTGTLSGTTESSNGPPVMFGGGLPL